MHILWAIILLLGVSVLLGLVGAWRRRTPSDPGGWREAPPASRPPGL